MLDLNFANFTDIKSVPFHSASVTPDTYHPPLSTDAILPHVNNNLKYECSYRNVAAGNYALLYNILSSYNWSSMYDTTSVDVAVASLNVAVRGATEHAIPSDYSCESKFPRWFSYILRY
jgi:hypothetical protein